MSYKEEKVPAIYIVTEGVSEAVGKSTVVGILKTKLEQLGHEVLTYRQPGGTPAAEDMRRIVKNPDYGSEEINEVVEYLLFSASREQSDHNIVRPALEKGVIVISDRHYLTTHAYQGTRRPEIDRLVARKPDMTVFLEAPFELCMKRMKARGDVCRIESRGEEWFREVYAMTKKCINDGIHGEVVRIDTTDFNSDLFKEGIEMAVSKALDLQKAKLASFGLEDEFVTIKEFEQQVLDIENVRVILRADVNIKVRPYKHSRLDDNDTYGDLKARIANLVNVPFSIASVVRNPTNDTILSDVRIPMFEGVCECQ